MKIRCFTTLLMVVLLSVMTSCDDNQSHDNVVVELRSRNYDFSSEQSPRFVINQEDSEIVAVDVDAKQGFTISLSANLMPAHDAEQVTLFEIEGVVKLISRLHNPQERTAQNYAAYKLKDGGVPVVEAELVLHPTEGKGGGRLVVGVPLAMLPSPYGEHDIVLHFTGVEWGIYIDGKLYDSDFAIGYPMFSDRMSVQRAAAVVGESEFFAPALAPLQVEDFCVDNNIQYWAPPYHNAWVGDVATIYHQGRYHVFYLFDRRGHASKLGRGGHYFEHLSTEDFKTWIEHETAVPIEHQWETLGTGTPFVADGKLCLAYGLHTTRIYGREETSLPMMWDYYKKHGKTQVFDYATLEDLSPAGSTYSVSRDGVSDFEKSRMLIHPCENPSIFTDENQRLRMLANYGAKGEWSADSLQEGWECVNEHFPPGGDCTFYFEWGGYDYIIGGFNQLYSRRHNEGDDSWVNEVALGRDMYNGMSVPAISEISSSRRLIAGWVKTQNWGGVLAIHELVQFANGSLGSKWMEEIIPDVEPAIALSAHDDIRAESPSFMLTFDIEPVKAYQGRVGVTFSGQDGVTDGCEWQLQFDRGLAQFAAAGADDFARCERTLREGADVAGARNYAIVSGAQPDEATQVRMIVYHNDKFDGSIIDVEIASQRTMISYRANLLTEKIDFRLDGVKIKNLRMAKLKE